MPIHLRANPGDYAEACLLPGDPLRAKYIAETFFDDPVEVNSYRGLLGYTGTFEGKPVSVQTSGMGCPSAAIVIEELVQLGVKKILRVGTCGGLRADVMGELIVPLSAAAADTTAMLYVDSEPYAPTANFEIVHELVHQAKELGKTLRVGPIVSSSVFYQPDQGQARRWAERGILAVEMEAAVLFTLGALRDVQAGCVLLVSDLVPGVSIQAPAGGGGYVYMSDEDMRKAVDSMSELALHTVTADHSSH
jgi:DeoD family purine-nucleoside phosphorylase